MYAPVNSVYKQSEHERRSAACLRRQFDVMVAYDD